MQKVLKELKDKILRALIIRPLVNMKFLNYMYPHVHGPKERLIIKDPGNVHLQNTLFNTRCGTITLGRGVMFSHNCMVLTGKHDYVSKDIKKIRDIVEEGERSIEIGDGTWVCTGAIICGKVKVGKHCVIAAGAVVTKDVPDGCMAAGVPAKVIKEI